MCSASERIHRSSRLAGFAGGVPAVMPSMFAYVMKKL
jgi:hypothetical protein